MYPRCCGQSILCFVTWPTFLWGVRLLGGRRTLAATLMALLVAALLVAPFVIVGVSLADNVSHLAAVISRELEHGPPEPPAWVADLPLVGHRLHTAWQGLIQDSSRLTTTLQRLVPPVSTWLLGQGVALGAGVLHLSLSVLLLFFLYRDGATFATRLQEVTGRIAGVRAQQLVVLAVSTVRGVVYGILGSILAQGILPEWVFWYPACRGRSCSVFSPSSSLYCPADRPCSGSLPASGSTIKALPAGRSSWSCGVCSSLVLPTISSNPISSAAAAISPLSSCSWACSVVRRLWRHRPLPGADLARGRLHRGPGLGAGRARWPLLRTPGLDRGVNHCLAISDPGRFRVRCAHARRPRAAHVRTAHATMLCYWR